MAKIALKSNRTNESLEGPSILPFLEAVAAARYLNRLLKPTNYVFTHVMQNAPAECVQVDGSQTVTHDQLDSRA